MTEEPREITETLILGLPRHHIVSRNRSSGHCSHFNTLLQAHCAAHLCCYDTNTIAAEVYPTPKNQEDQTAKRTSLLPLHSVLPSYCLAAPTILTSSHATHPCKPQHSPLQNCKSVWLSKLLSAKQTKFPRQIYASHTGWPRPSLAH